MSEMAKSIFRGLMFSLAAALLICAAEALISLFLDIPEKYILILSALILAAAAYISAYRSTQLYRSKGLIQGLLCGAAVFLTALFLSVLSGSFGFGELTAIKAVLCIIFGAVGGVKGINTKKTKL